MISNINQRIDEIYSHHQARLLEILSLIKELGSCCVRDLVIKMHWDISAKDWNDFPASQKWFAAGEAAAHVVYLLNQGKISETMIDGVAYYRCLE